MATRVTFTAECTDTQLGEAVFVVGSDRALGCWSVQGALPLRTNGSIFPQWTSDEVQMDRSREVEYKFIIMPESGRGGARWEAFEGNRKLDCSADATMAVRAVWGEPRADVCGIDPSSLHKDPSYLGRESWPPSADAAASMEEVLNQRDPMRRNFSQSLLNSSGGSSGDMHGMRMFDDDGTSVARCGVPIKHISSFSALTEMAAAEEKTTMRRKRGRGQSYYKPFNTDVPIVIVTSEIAPFSKSGGLGLVAASYSAEFPRSGHRTMVIAPKYQHYDGINLVGETTVRVNGNDEVVKFWHYWKEVIDGRGCDFVFVDHPAIEREGGLYNGPDGSEWGDNLFRFSVLCQAAMEAPLMLHLGGYPYGDKVMFLANDWQAGLVPLYLHYRYRCSGRYTQARCIYVVHNLGYQGQYSHIDACSFFSISEAAAMDLVLGDCINLTKGALICTDRVLTVSPNYSWEIQTPEGGFGLHEFIQGKANGMRLSGILNGIDDIWCPEDDKQIFDTYCPQSFVEGKRANKSALQRSLGLHQNCDVVLIGFVGRLTWQKGIDVLAEVIPWLMEDTGNGVNSRCQLIIMGNGENQHANMLRWAESTYRGRVCGYVGFDPKVEHQMMAGCDLLLMPSRYEPCGLPQMICQQYGCLPIVTATGGLRDSVKDISEGVHDATGFHTAADGDALKSTLYLAMQLFLHHPFQFQTMQRTAMETDFYWPKAIDEYEQVFDFTLYDPPNFR